VGEVGKSSLQEDKDEEIDGVKCKLSYSSDCGMFSEFMRGQSAKMPRRTDVQPTGRIAILFVEIIVVGGSTSILYYMNELHTIRSSIGYDFLTN
jgi:hypothetical protein